MESINIKNTLKDQINQMADKLSELRQTKDNKNYRNILDLLKITWSTYMRYTDRKSDIDYRKGIQLKVEKESKELIKEMDNTLKDNKYQVYRDWNICFNKLCDILDYIKY